MRTHLVVSTLLALLAGCSGSGSAPIRDGGATIRDAESGLTLRYPRDWRATGFSQTVSPRRLVVASYDVKTDQVEGDCGGMRALQALPAAGAAVLLIDYGSAARFAQHPNSFTLSEFEHANYECFGPSYMLRFRRGGEDIQAFVAFGSRASADRQQQALSILDSLKG
jgi:hypothetical protein